MLYEKAVHGFVLFFKHKSISKHFKIKTYFCNSVFILIAILFLTVATLFFITATTLWNFNYLLFLPVLILIIELVHWFGFLHLNLSSILESGVNLVYFQKASPWVVRIISDSHCLLTLNLIVDVLKGLSGIWRIGVGIFLIHKKILSSIFKMFSCKSP